MVSNSEGTVSGGGRRRASGGRKAGGACGSQRADGHLPRINSFSRGGAGDVCCLFDLHGRARRSRGHAPLGPWAAPSSPGRPGAPPHFRAVRPGSGRPRRPRRGADRSRRGARAAGLLRGCEIKTTCAGVSGPRPSRPGTAAPARFPPASAFRSQSLRGPWTTRIPAGRAVVFYFSFSLSFFFKLNERASPPPTLHVSKMTEDD